MKFPRIYTLVDNEERVNGWLDNNGCPGFSEEGGGTAGSVRSVDTEVAKFDRREGGSATFGVLQAGLPGNIGPRNS